MSYKVGLANLLKLLTSMRSQHHDGGFEVGEQQVVVALVAPYTRGVGLLQGHPIDEEKRGGKIFEGN